MPRGRPRKPLEQHVLEGTYRADRHGPLPSGAGGLPSGAVPAKPRGLSGEAGRAWDELTRLLGGVLKASDGLMLSEAAKWMGWAREVEKLLKKLTPADDAFPRLLRSRALCGTQLDRVLNRFGLTPADRAKLGAPTDNGSITW